MPAPSSRAAEVLERLAGEHDRRPLYRRDPTGESEPVGERLQQGPLRWRRMAGPVAVAVCVVAIGAALLLDRRPPPIEERLPVASEEQRPGAAAGEPSSTTAPAPAAETRVLVHVAGAVASPGVVELTAGSRVVDAVRAAGGLRADADPDRVNLAAELADGQRVVIPAVGQQIPAEVLPSGPGGEPGTSPDAAPALVDLNTASAAELEDLPGVGPATAAAILAHRDQHGRFSSVDALIDVRGIGEAKLDALRDLVTVGGAP